MQTPRKTHRPLAKCLTAIGLAASWVAISACTTQSNPEPGARKAALASIAATEDPDELHAQLYAENGYPTAAQCGVCHPKHFAEWSVSPHAYAQISPVFNAMQGSVTKLTNGANADFCIRCHSPVGMALGEPTFTENKNRAQASLEGVTCIVCHRVNGDSGKVSGRFKLEKGDIDAAVFGPGDGSELERILAENEDPEGFFENLQTTAEGEGNMPIHGEVKTSFFMSQPGMCGTCHDVTSPGGFRLEEAFS